MRWKPRYRLIAIIACTGVVMVLAHSFVGYRSGATTEQGKGFAWLSEFMPWNLNEIDLDVRYSRAPILMPISTLEELKGLSGDDAFWRFEVWVRAASGKPAERIHVCIQAIDHERHLPVSQGQVVTLQKSDQSADSAGRYCYRPSTRIVFVGSENLEVVSEDRVGVFFRDDCELRITLVED